MERVGHLSQYPTQLINMTKNKILTTLNQRLASTNLYSLLAPDGTPLETDVLEGIPLGTDNNAEDGELAVKVIVIADRSQASQSSIAGITIPNSDYTAFTYYGSTNNIETAIYYIGGSGGTVVATLTYTYVGSGSADDDNILTITKS